MRKLRVCIYGGPSLDVLPAAFIEAFAYAILGEPDTVIVTGGLMATPGQSFATTTDVAALAGARRYARDHGLDVADCFEAWIPDAAIDSARHQTGKVRMTAAEGVRIVPVAGRTALGRRLAMVRGVDVVVTISGHVHTEVLIEQALEVGTPVLPIPFVGGDSKRLLKTHRPQIAARFAAGALDTCLATVKATLETEPQVAAAAVVDLLRTAKVGRCLVLMPFGGDDDLRFHGIIAPAVEAHMFTVRLDRLPSSGQIAAAFAREMGDAEAVIVDITSLNDNVMYEIGYAHALGITPLLFARDQVRIDALPIYLRTLNVPLVDDARLPELIDQHLMQVKRRRGLRG